MRTRALLPGKNKFDRVRDLVEWGFNAPLYFHVDEKYIWDLRYKLDELIKAYGPISIRCICGPMAGNFWLGLKIIPEETLDSVHESQPIMVSASLDPIDCIWFGNFAIDGDDFLLEACKGPGTIRELRWGKISPDFRLIGNWESLLWRNIRDYQIIRLIEECKKFPFEVGLLEFCIYKGRVGVNKTDLIFWDYEILEVGWLTHVILTNQHRRLMIS